MRLWWALRLALLLLSALAAWLLAVPTPIVGVAVATVLVGLALVARRRRVSGNVRAVRSDSADPPAEDG